MTKYHAQFVQFNFLMKGFQTSKFYSLEEKTFTSGSKLKVIYFNLEVKI